MTTTQVGTKLGIRKITARIGLFIGDFAQRIVGLAKGESYELLKILQRYVTARRTSCGSPGSRAS
jgi:hypothetical protein